VYGLKIPLAGCPIQGYPTGRIWCGFPATCDSRCTNAADRPLRAPLAGLVSDPEAILASEASRGSPVFPGGRRPPSGFHHVRATERQLRRARIVSARVFEAWANLRATGRDVVPSSQYTIAAERSSWCIQ